MLARNFKSPVELGLTDAQHAALVKTLGLLERGELTWRPVLPGHAELHGSFTAHFNMSMWNIGGECETICCIGGTAELVGGLESGELNSVENAALRRLLLPPRPANWSDITVAEAATALAAYLTTGEADWSCTGKG